MKTSLLLWPKRTCRQWEQERPRLASETTSKCANTSKEIWTTTWCTFSLSWVLMVTWMQTTNYSLKASSSLLCLKNYIRDTFWVMFNVRTAKTSTLSWAKIRARDSTGWNVRNVTRPSQWPPSRRVSLPWREEAGETSELILNMSDPFKSYQLD